MKTKTTNKLLVTSKNANKKIKFFWGVLRESKLFIIFSFLSCILPIIFCLLSSLIKPNGSQAVMAIGYVSPFLLAFMQISFSMSMIIFAQLNKLKQKESLKWKNEHTIMSSAIWISLLLGIIMVIFYVLSCFLYMHFSNNRPNTQATMYYGYDYINSTIIFVLLFPVFTTLLFYIYYKKEKSALILIITFFVLVTLFSYLFAIVLEWKILGMGFGTTFALLIVTPIAFYIVKIKHKIIIYYPSQVKYFKLLISKKIAKESLTSISMSVFKGIAIVCLSFAIPLAINDFVPLPYQMSRVLWFNMMYFIPFIGIGLGEAIRMHYLKHGNVLSCTMDHNWKNDLTMIICTLLLTILIATGCIFLINPLINVYVKNDYNPFQNGKMPDIKGWGSPTIPPNKIVDLKELSKLNLSEFPTLKPLKELTGNPIKDAIIKIENAKITLENLNKINQWTKEQIANNPQELQEIIENISGWIKWLNQTNEQDITLIQFIENKYQLNGSFQIIINSIVKGDDQWKNEINKFAPVLKNGMSYIVYTWLYSNTNSIVTESFINIRPLIENKNLIEEYTKDGQLNLAQLLVDHNIVDLLPSLFLKIQTFNAKSMIYICIFTILNSTWAIILQTNARNFGKSMPYWLMSTVYFVCVTFLVTFGVLFGVTFKEQLGSNNPFQYLDAWTFPLVVISILVIIVLSIKAIKSNHYIKKEKNNKNINEKIMSKEDVENVQHFNQMGDNNVKIH